MSHGQLAMWSTVTVDTIAEVKKVVWRPVTASTVIKVGQPVCYNSDLAANVKEETTARASGDLGGGGVTTFAEGAQTYNARFLIVEEPLTANLEEFAGVVKSLGPEGGKDGDTIEIYLPNGAVVPCYCEIDADVNVSVFGIADGEADFVEPGTPVGLAVETIDRSSVDGLCWARIDPKIFNTQRSLTNNGLTGCVMNTIQNTYANTSGTACGLLVQTVASGVLAAAHNEWSILSYLGVTGGITAAGYSRAVLAQLVLGGTINSGGAVACALHAQIGGTVTNTEMQRAAAGIFEYALSENPNTGDADVIFLYANGAEDVDSYVHMWGDGEKANVIWKFSGCGGLSTSVLIKKMGTGGMWTNTGTWMQIPIDINGTTYYIPAGALLSEA